MFVLPVRPLKEAILHHPGECLGFTSAVARGGKQNPTMSLKPQRSRGISPDLWAGTLAILFIHSFLLLFLKLPICSGSSWDSYFSVSFFFSKLPFSVARATAVRLAFTSEPFLWWTPCKGPGCLKAPGLWFSFNQQTLTRSRARSFLLLFHVKSFLSHSQLLLCVCWGSLPVYCISPAKSSWCSTSSKLWYVWHYIVKSLLSTGRTSSCCQFCLHAWL